MAAAMLGLLGSTSASALESGFYFGGLGSRTSVDIDKNEYDEWERDPRATSFSSSLEDSDTAYGIFAGGQFGRWFAAEAQLMHLGTFTYHATQTVPNAFSTAPRALETRSHSETEAAAATFSGILTIPVGEQFAVGVRLGVAVSATEASYEYEERRGNVVIASYSDEDFEDYDNTSDNISATYGLSFEWDPTRHFGLRLEYQRIADVGEDEGDEFEEGSDGKDVDLLSLNLIGRF